MVEPLCILGRGRLTLTMRSLQGLGRTHRVAKKDFRPSAHHRKTTTTMWAQLRRCSMHKTLGRSLPGATCGTLPGSRDCTSLRQSQKPKHQNGMFVSVLLRWVSSLPLARDRQWHSAYILDVWGLNSYHRLSLSTRRLGIPGLW